MTANAPTPAPSPAPLKSEPDDAAPVPVNLVLVGFMGSGKSSIGRILATRQGTRLLDTDALVVEEAGMPITEIFAQSGEEGFRQREAETLRRLVEKYGSAEIPETSSSAKTEAEKPRPPQGWPGLVISTGGGIVTRAGNIPLLHRLGFVVELRASEAVIFERVSRNRARPLLHTPNPRETIARLLAARAPLYAAAAHFSLDTSEKSHAEVAAEILAEARQRFA